MIYNMHFKGIKSVTSMKKSNNKKEKKNQINESRKYST